MWAESICQINTKNTFSLKPKLDVISNRCMYRGYVLGATWTKTHTHTHTHTPARNLPYPQKQQIVQPPPTIPVTLAYLYVIYILILFKNTCGNSEFGQIRCARLTVVRNDTNSIKNVVIKSCLNSCFLNV